MNELTVIGNQIEAVLWFLFAAGFGWRAFRLSGERRRLAAMLAIAFVAFSISDLIEAHTGAWWRPTWLLVLKSSCIAVFVCGFWRFLRVRKAQHTGRRPQAAANARARDRNEYCGNRI